MMAVELEASIMDHRLEVVSDRLPAHKTMARVIVLYDDDDKIVHEKKTTNNKESLAQLLANPYPPKGDGLPMKREDLYDRPGMR
ncbi:MAG: hypothetical protein HQL65_19180 [Magnetococcales bacterium]|nr:hypothetical protein [Magnetococcales bacterium]MBF0155531.1 hypothetical protein [Magnetococcales bacterium]